MNNLEKQFRENLKKNNANENYMHSNLSELLKNNSWIDVGINRFDYITENYNYMRADGTLMFDGSIKFNDVHPFENGIGKVFYQNENNQHCCNLVDESGKFLFKGNNYTDIYVPQNFHDVDYFIAYLRGKDKECSHCYIFDKKSENKLYKDGFIAFRGYTEQGWLVVYDYNPQMYGLISPNTFEREPLSTKHMSDKELKDFLSRKIG